MDGLEFARFARPLVGEIRQHLALRVLDDDAERRRLPREVAETVGELGVELQNRARTRPVEVLVELGDDHS